MLFDIFIIFSMFNTASCIFMIFFILAAAGNAFDPFNQGIKGPAPPLEKKAEDR